MMKPLVGALSVSLVLTAAASAQTPAGGEFQVNTYTYDRQYFARPAMGPNGAFVVVWMSYGQDGSRFGVFGRRFAASGAPLGSEFRINAYTTEWQGGSAVTVGSQGAFIVVWTSVQGLSRSILGQRYDATGVAIGSEFQASSSVAH